MQSKSAQLIYSNKQQWAAAISDYTMGIVGAPNNSDLYYNRAIAYGSTNEWEKAAADFTMTLKLNPQNKAAYSNREFAYSRIRAMKGN